LKRLFIVQNGLVDRHSHYYGETKGWREVCRARGIALHLYINSHALPDIVEELSANPAFPYAPDIILDKDAVSGRLSDFITLSEQFAQSCAALERDGITADDDMVVSYSTERDMFGAALWLERIPAARRPTIVFIFHGPNMAWTFDADRAKFKGEFSYFRYAMKRMRAVTPAEKVVVYATGARLAKVLEGIFQHPCEYCPLPTYYVSNDVLVASDEQTGPRVNVRLAGGLRWEKGDDLALQVIFRVAGLRPGTSFAVQVHDRQHAEAIAGQLAPLSGTRSRCYVQAGQLSHELYQRRLVHSDILLLPYRQTSYALRSSGVFSEAAGLGIVTVVPSRTWMADLLNEGCGAGTIFDEPTVDGASTALVAAIDGYAELSAQARRRAPDWRRTNSVAALLDKIVQRTAPV